MIRLFGNAHYDFSTWRRWAYGLTAAIIIPGFALFLVRGLNYSIEFTGGTLIQVQTAEPVGTERIRGALDGAGIRDAEIQQFGAANEYVIRARIGRDDRGRGGLGAGALPRPGTRALQDPPHRGRRPESGAGAPGQGFPRDLLLVHRHARLPRGPVRVALRPRGGARDVPRHPHHDRVHPVPRPRGESRRRRGGPDHGRLLPQRHHHHFRSRAREPAQIPAPEPVRDPQSLDQRDAAALRADARDDHGDDGRTRGARGRGVAALRAGDDLRDLHRDLLVDLHRRPPPHVHREALAG